MRLLYVAFIGFVAFVAFSMEQPIVGGVAVLYAIYILCGGSWFFFFY